MLLNDPTLTAEKISIQLNKTKRTAERYLKALQERSYIERTGSDKKGYVELIELVENNKELQLKVFFSFFNNFVQLNDPRIFESLEKKYNPIF